MSRFINPIRWGAVLTLALGQLVSSLATTQPQPADAGTRSGAFHDYFVVVTGGELLQGVYADGHTVYLTRALSPWGFRCVGSISIDDQRQDLLVALRFATNRASVVIVTGGLGPTDDDITRETLSAFTGIPLVEDPDLLKRMSQRFGVPEGQLRQNLRRQTKVALGGYSLPNAAGTAAGLVFLGNQQVLVALPGPPRELRPMVERYLIPYLSDRFGLQAPGASVRLRFVGIGESSIDEALHTQVNLPTTVITSSLFEAGRVDLTLRLPGGAESDQTTLTQLKKEILKVLGAYVYAEGDASLEQVILRSLAKKGAGLAIAEVGTHGWLSASMQAEPEANRVVHGGFVAPSARSLCRLLGGRGEDSDEVEEANRDLEKLTEQLAKRAGVKHAVMVGERYRTADGTMNLPVFWLRPDGSVSAWELNGSADPEWLVTSILDRVRKELGD